jgi:hypothetical protein
MFAPGASRRTDLEGPSLDLQCLTLGQGQRHLAAGPGEDTLEGGARDLHAGGGGCLGQALQIGQAQCFELLLEEHDAAQVVQRHPGGLVDGGPGRTAEKALLAGTGHGS